jgi:hypothetical protein
LIVDTSIHVRLSRFKVTLPGAYGPPAEALDTGGIFLVQIDPVSVSLLGASAAVRGLPAIRPMPCAACRSRA